MKSAHHGNHDSEGLVPGLNVVGNAYSNDRRSGQVIDPLQLGEKSLVNAQHFDPNASYIMRNMPQVAQEVAMMGRDAKIMEATQMKNRS